MASSRTVTVGTSAARLTSTSRAGGRNVVDVAIQNLGAADIFVGGSDVTTGNGIKVVATSGRLDVHNLADEDDLYAISGSSGNDVRVLEV